MMYFNTLESSDLLYRPQLAMFNFTYCASEQAQKVANPLTQYAQYYAHNYCNNAKVDSSYATLGFLMTT